MKSEIVKVTPQFAKDLLSLNTKNRRMNRAHVDFLKKQMLEGSWKDNGSPIRISTENVLLDGQHRLQAISELNGVSFDIVIITDIEPDTMDTIDTNCNLRTAKDLFYMNGYANANEVISIVTKYFVFRYDFNGIDRVSLLSKKAGMKRMATGEIIKEYESNTYFYQSISSFSAKIYTKKRLLSKSIIGGLYAYLVKDLNWESILVEEFFSRINQLNENDVCGIFGNILLKEKIASRKMSREHKCALLVKAWNAFVTGKDVVRLTYNSLIEQRPVFLANTSINFNEKGVSNE